MMTFNKKRFKKMKINTCPYVKYHGVGVKKLPGVDVKKSTLFSAFQGRWRGREIPSFLRIFRHYYGTHCSAEVQYFVLTFLVYL